MPGGAINYLTRATNAALETNYYATAISPQLLRRGKNVLAVEIHQLSPVSSDISFNLELSGAGNIPPEVTITTPADQSTFIAGQNIPVAANAFDTYGGVQVVEFFANNTSLGQDSVAPYQVAWPSSAPGIYNLVAVAVDNSGGATASSPVRIVLQPPPSVRVTRSGAQLVLSWTEQNQSYALETTFSLNPPVTWTPATNSVQSNGEERTVVIDPSADSQFFRLVPSP
jgi:hypothetical protein